MKNYVFYDDTDCGGIVYHAQYFVFCERARSLLFFQNNMPAEHNNHGFVVKKIESSFIATLQLGDQYQVKTTLVTIKNASVVLKQEVFKIDEIAQGSTEMKDFGNTPVFSMQVQLAYIDLINKKPSKIPSDIMPFLQALQTR